MTTSNGADDVCAAALRTLAVAIKASGRTMEEHASNQDLTEEEKLVFAYLRHRASTRGAQTQTGSNGSERAPADSAPEDAEDGPPAAAEASQPAASGGAQTAQQRPETAADAALKTRPPGGAEVTESATGEDDMDNPADQPQEVDMKAPSGGIPKVGHRPATSPERVMPPTNARANETYKPNARANKPYEGRIEGYSGVRWRGDAVIGLQICEDGSLSSEGMSAGDYQLLLHGVKDSRSVEIVARLSVIAHPQDLWTSIPSNQKVSLSKQVPLAKPDEAFGSVQTPDAFLVAASKRGRSHAREGTYRDDHFELMHDDASGWHVMVVADGAGSARFSREGSRLACSITCEMLRTYLPEIVNPAAKNMIEGLKAATTKEEKRAGDVLTPVVNSLTRAALDAADGIDARARALGCHPADLSTTLVIAAAKKIEDEWLLMSFSIGDGGVGIWDSAKGELVLMCTPDSGEFAGQTRFLSADDLDKPEERTKRVFAELRQDFTAFVAMTDGITDPKFETDAGLANTERWRRFWQDDLTKEVTFSHQNTDLEKQFLGWMDFWSRGNHDDRTLAVMLTKDQAPATQAGEDTG